MRFYFPSEICLSCAALRRARKTGSRTLSPRVGRGGGSMAPLRQKRQRGPISPQEQFVNHESSAFRRRAISFTFSLRWAIFSWSTSAKYSMSASRIQIASWSVGFLLLASFALLVSCCLFLFFSWNWTMASRMCIAFLVTLLRSKSPVLSSQRKLIHIRICSSLHRGALQEEMGRYLSVGCVGGSSAMVRRAVCNRDLILLLAVGMQPDFDMSIASLSQPPWKQTMVRPTRIWL
jgi:hypothetical protein